MIEFTLQYDQNTQELLVIVHNCKVCKILINHISLCLYNRFFTQFFIFAFCLPGIKRRQREITDPSIRQDIHPS